MNLVPIRCLREPQQNGANVSILGQPKAA